MELLHLVGTEQQKREWLAPLLAGDIRWAFAMTDPRWPAATQPNITTAIQRQGEEYISSGHKWWVSGAADPRCQLLIVMGKTDPAAAPHRQQSMVLVPVDGPGVNQIRSTPVFGRQDQHGS